MPRKVTRFRPPQPPSTDLLPLVHGSGEIGLWLQHYWSKLRIPANQLRSLAVTSSRDEFSVWTGRRLNPMMLGCYCYLPLPEEDDNTLAALAGALGRTAEVPGLYGQNGVSAVGVEGSTAADSQQMALPGFAPARSTAPVAVAVLERGAESETSTLDSNYRHLIFVEPGLLPLSVEITVAHELIHLADRVRGTPRRHRCHGYDSIATDEAAVTGRDPEMLRELLRQETDRREEALRQLRPSRYLYICPTCQREYRRVRRYPRAVSCGKCAVDFDPRYQLRLHALLDKSGSIERLVTPEEKAALHRGAAAGRGTSSKSNRS